MLKETFCVQKQLQFPLLRIIYFIRTWISQLSCQDYKVNKKWLENVHDSIKAEQ